MADQLTPTALQRLADEDLMTLVERRDADAFAVLYDRQLNERSKAITLYRDVVEHDIDPERIRTAERRLAELTGGKK